MTEFKQIIGRGTRVRDDYGKLCFNILDYTGSATRLFADPDFDGDPAIETEEEIDEKGEPVDEGTVITPEPPADEPETVIDGPPEIIEPPTGERRKFYFDGGQVEIAAHLVYELDPDGKQLRVVTLHRLHRRQGAHALRQRPRAPRGLGRSRTARRDHREARRARHRVRPAGRGGRAARGRPVRPALPRRLQRAACARGASGRSDLQARAEGLLRPVRPGGAGRSWTSSWKNTPSTAPRSS